MGQGTLTLLLWLGGGAALAPPGALYLGIDLSTQSCTAVVVDDRLDVVHRHSVCFDDRFPWYGTESGFHAGDEGRATSPVSMWLDGLDCVLDELPASLLQEVDAISFSGQQHGAVYWTQEAVQLLRGPARGEDDPEFNPELTTKHRMAPAPRGLRGGLRERLCPGAFSLKDAPIWADASTQDQCDALEDALGGPEEVAKRTGSRAYARFTANQMAAVAQRAPDVWRRTSEVSLVSAFGPSVLCGAITPVDASDSCGTNVGMLQDRKWGAKCTEAYGKMAGVGGAAEFRKRLGKDPVEPGTRVGTVAPWVAHRFGFRSAGRTMGQRPPSVFVGAGDNPSTAAGLGLAAPGDVALSLGTSDTFMAVAKTARPRVEGHVFASCTQPGEFLALLCYANGGPSRERIKRDLLGSKATWDEFGRAIGRAPPGNGGVLGLELATPEITPVIAKAGRFFVDGDGRRIRLGDGQRDPVATGCRAVVEGRFLSMRGRGAALGVDATGGRVLAAGGASRSPEIMQVAADVLGAPVYAADVPDAAALGAAFRAAHGASDYPSYDTFLSAHGAGASSLDVVARPRHAHLYTPDVVARYLRLEDDVARGKWGD